MENLAKCAAHAKAAGLSYGQYMAVKGETRKAEAPKQKSEFMKKCQRCGNEFYWPYKRRKIFCDSYCQKAAAADRYRREKAKEDNADD